MKLSRELVPGSSGVIATAAKNGTVNTAIYSVPQIIDDETVAWGLTEGRTHANLLENPNAAFLYQSPAGGVRGLRLTLVLRNIEDGGKTLQAVRSRVGWSVSPRAAESVKYVAYFKVVETRPLM